MLNAIENFMDALSPPWPLVVLILGLAFIFRKHIPGMVKNIKRLKVPGFEIELHQNLEQLRKDAVEAASTIEPAEHALSGISTGTSGVTGNLEVASDVESIPAKVFEKGANSERIYGQESVSIDAPDKTDVIVSTILNEAANDPKVALIRLSMELEKELRVILGRAGYLVGKNYLPVPNALRIIESDYHVLSAPVIDAIQSFWRVRNQLIHGGEGSRNEVLSAIDSGLMVLKTLQQQPFARFFVLQSGLPVYADKQGTKLRSDVKAIVTEEVGAGGLMRTKNVVLTTRSHYKPGMEIAWEADTDHTIDAPVWYRDPETNEMIGSDQYGPIDFIGRDMNDLRNGK